MRCVPTFLSKPTCWTYFQWPFSSFCRPYDFFISLFLSFLNRYASSSNGETPTIQQFIYKYFSFFRIQLVLDRLLIFCVRTLRIFWFFLLISFDNFFQVSFFRKKLFRLHLKGSVIFVIFWSSPQTVLSLVSDLLFRYVSRILMHWITQWQNLNGNMRLAFLCGREMRVSLLSWKANLFIKFEEFLQILHSRIPF